jgi:ABC-type multidrug transport system ATPase subunit
MNFSALLRQPPTTSKKDKLAYVDKVIDLLDMHDYVDAIVGVVGEGLNIEQRKRLTIGVELAAKPPLLLFIDEPTSGLDSQTSWAILDLLERLSKAGQSILCTIHQPSVMLFQRFDRLLLLTEGGRTVYFGQYLGEFPQVPNHFRAWTNSDSPRLFDIGDIGENSKILTGYFERNGASSCPAGANPAEWMLETIGAAPGTFSEVDWHQEWRSGPEYRTVQTELAQFRALGTDQVLREEKNDNPSYQQFAAPLSQQFAVVTRRVFQQYWRTPSYIYSKLGLCIWSSLFIGMVFLDAPLTI